MSLVLKTSFNAGPKTPSTCSPLCTDMSASQPSKMRDEWVRGRGEGIWSALPSLARALPVGRIFVIELPLARPRTREYAAVGAVKLARRAAAVVVSGPVRTGCTGEAIRPEAGGGGSGERVGFRGNACPYIALDPGRHAVSTMRLRPRSRGLGCNGYRCRAQDGRARSHEKRRSGTRTGGNISAGDFGKVRHHRRNCSARYLKPARVALKLVVPDTRARIWAWLAVWRWPLTKPTPSDTAAEVV